ncbi:MAG TPA: phospho-N-acetylmuramoyl-pentapeptide-transferase [Bacillota bacterium]|nr:phospho-N-acetylmuramoyl-pentapeptide-transferase [Bacillota bacterium]
MALWITIAKWVIIVMGSFFTGRILLPRLAVLLHEANFTRINYRGEAIPSGGGILFLLGTPVWMGIALILGIHHFTIENTFLFIFVIMGMGMVGFFDDVLGSQDAKGFSGHFGALFRGRLTSGALKALYGGIIATLFSIGLWVLEGQHTNLPIWLRLYQFFLNIAVIALSTNLINLLDLRPGRAGKSYLIAIVIAFFLSKQPELFQLAIPLSIILIAYIRADLKAWIMMGDVGSNLLGGVLGIMIAWTFTPPSKTVAFILLLSLNLLSERFSFSRIIERFRVLRFLDELGRGRTD